MAVVTKKHFDNCVIEMKHCIAKRMILTLFKGREDNKAKDIDEAMSVLLEASREERKVRASVRRATTLESKRR